jgi:hypothetical protein
MEINEIIRKVTGSQQAPVAEKTASAALSVDAAIEDALREAEATKTASDKGGVGGSPVEALMKVAAEAAAADEDANVKLAHRMGAAFVDGQVERMRQYEKAAEDLGGTEAEKQAAYEQGYNETVELIAKTAMAHFAIGHDAIVAVASGA